MKTPSSLKNIHLRNLISVPTIQSSGTASFSQGFNAQATFQAIHSDLSMIKHKALQAMDLSISRLEKVRHRIIDSGKAVRLS